MKPWFFGLAGLAILAAVPATAQEGYVEISGIADFTYGPEAYNDRGFVIFSYAVEAGFDPGSNSFDPQFFFFALDGIWQGLDNNIGSHGFSGGTVFNMPGVISFDLPADVTLFVDNVARTFAGTSPVFPATLDTADGPVGWSNLRNISLTLNFRPDAPIPEPATWLMLVAGFGLVGGAIRRTPGRRAA